jgi:ABC-type sugar transport system substrate-binding protein
MTLPVKACLTTLAIAVLALTTAPRLARADAQQQQSFTVWNQMADCARQAAKKFPDHTPEGNAKREADRRNCLRLRHLPVPTTPSPVGGQ